MTGFGRGARVVTVRAIHQERGHRNGKWLIGCAVLQVLLSGVLGSGCAIHYYDSESQVWHMWGVGHMWMKAIPEKSRQGEPVEVVAVVRGTETIGISVGATEDQSNLALGYRRVQRLHVLGENLAITELLWPDSDFANVRITRGFPDESATDESIDSE